MSNNFDLLRESLCRQSETGLASTASPSLPGSELIQLAVQMSKKKSLTFIGWAQAKAPATRPISWVPVWFLATRTKQTARKCSIVSSSSFDRVNGT